MALCIGLQHVHGTVVSPRRAPAGRTDEHTVVDDLSSRSGSIGDTNTQSDATTWYVPVPEAEPQHANDALPRTNGTNARQRRQSVGTRRLQGKEARSRCNLPHDTVIPSKHARDLSHTRIRVPWYNIILARILACNTQAQTKARTHSSTYLGAHERIFARIFTHARGFATKSPLSHAHTKAHDLAPS